MKQTISVSIGIPAYNEGRNLKNLLTALLAQKEDGFHIQEIIIMSDGSSDNSEEIVKSIGDKRIIFKADKKRLGKSARLDQIFRSFKSDVLFLMDADIIITDNEVMAKTLRGADLSKNGIIGINARPLPGKTVFEHTLEAGVLAMKEISKRWNDGNNYLSFKGCYLALDGKMARKIHMPAKVVNNDPYLYFAAKEQGYTPTYLENCVVYYRSPLTFSDHMKQTSRYQNSREELAQYFKLDFDKEYMIPRGAMVNGMLHGFMQKPFFFVPYIGVNLVSQFKKQTSIKSTWSIATTTK